ncbi:hypothetical protein FWD20_00280 [Candidatus Saccharibacteria bacterium]|nr:hypothetical protein [Candidatus Saccharibacteria bacterium]
MELPVTADEIVDEGEGEGDVSVSGEPESGEEVISRAERLSQRYENKAAKAGLRAADEISPFKAQSLRSKRDRLLSRAERARAGERFGVIGAVGRSAINKLTEARQNRRERKADRAAYQEERARKEFEITNIEAGLTKLRQENFDDINSGAAQANIDEQTTLRSQLGVAKRELGTFDDEHEHLQPRTLGGRMLGVVTGLQGSIQRAVEGFKFTPPEQMEDESDEDYNARLDDAKSLITIKRVVGGLAAGALLVGGALALAKLNQSGYDSTALDMAPDATALPTGSGSGNGLVNDAIRSVNKAVESVAADVKETATGAASKVGQFVGEPFSTGSGSTTSGTIIDNSDLTNALPGSRNSGAAENVMEAVQPTIPEISITVGQGGGYGDALVKYRPGATINWDAWNKATAPGTKLHGWLLENGAYPRPEGGNLGIADLSGEVPISVVEKLAEIPDIFK